MINESHMAQVAKYVNGIWSDSPLSGLIYAAKILGAAQAQATIEGKINSPIFDKIRVLENAVSILQSRVSLKMTK